jgi:hypothetical protein
MPGERLRLLSLAFSAGLRAAFSLVVEAHGLQPTHFPIPPAELSEGAGDADLFDPGLVCGFETFRPVGRTANESRRATELRLDSSLASVGRAVTPVTTA